MVLQALEETAVRFEADIPWTADKPYQQTGMMNRRDDALWQAFTAFAGYAYDASAWSDKRVLPLVSLADCGTEIVVRVDEAERDLLASAVEPVRLISHRAARARWRRRR
ncbi:hypothetical protein [Marmoricola sp. URHB0036]|uniref:hypothetical protein n=1 Tax=Marmoricola sp. URHB0036 TaxID=1298863 RepID=UPI0003F6B537|nr:hypothetical protein [Marmoricola sp. URHB0036]